MTSHCLDTPTGTRDLGPVASRRDRRSNASVATRRWPPWRRSTLGPDVSRGPGASLGCLTRSWSGSGLVRDFPHCSAGCRGTRWRYDNDPGSAPTPTLDLLFATLRRSPVRRSQDGVIAGSLRASPTAWEWPARSSRGYGRSRAARSRRSLYLLALASVPDAQGRIRLEGLSAMDRPRRSCSWLSRCSRSSPPCSAAPGSLGLGMPGMPGMYGHGAGLWLLLVLAVISVIGVKTGWFSGRPGRDHLGQHDQPPPPPAPTGGPARTRRAPERYQVVFCGSPDAPVPAPLRVHLPGHGAPSRRNARRSIPRRCQEPVARTLGRGPAGRAQPQRKRELDPGRPSHLLTEPGMATASSLAPREPPWL